MCSVVLSGQTKMTEYTREQLIELCLQGIVPVKMWSNRDTAHSQQKLGMAAALLTAGCDFYFTADPKTDESTIWIEISFPGFQAFEYGPSDREYYDTELFYIPTPKRLRDADGGDWY